ncbi:hypothetical protein FQZ97_796690 [compost metagenome]
MRQALDDRQPDSESARPVAARVVDLIELLEDAAQLLRRNADAGVTNLQPHLVSSPPRDHAHTALVGVLQGVVDQIRKQAEQQLDVAAHPHATGTDAQLQALLFSVGGEGLIEDKKQRIEFQCLRFRHDDARIEMRHVEHGVQ